MGRAHRPVHRSRRPPAATGGDGLAQVLCRLCAQVGGEGGATDDPGILTAYIRNIGKTTIVLDGSATIYVGGKDSEFVLKVDDVTTTEIEQGKVGILTITDPLGPDESTECWKAGITYDVKIIAADNTQLTFNQKCS